MVTSFMDGLLGDEIFCGIQIWNEKELRSDSVLGGTKATHTMGLGIHLLAGIKAKFFLESAKVFKLGRN